MSRPRVFPLALLAGALLTACVDDRVETPAEPTPQLAQGGVKGKPIKDRWIVVLKEDAPDVRGLANQMRGNGQLHHVYEHALKGFALTLPESALNGIRNNPHVAYIEQDVEIELDAAGTQPSPPWGLDRIDQRALPLSTSYAYSVSGQGVTAYILDTGIRITHTDFGGRASHGYNAATGGTDASDCNGHGTHVAGTVGGTKYGVAKNASLVAVKVFSGCNSSTPASTIVAGLNWVTANADKPAAANMSLGGSATASIDQAVRNLVGSGVTVVVAAGNEDSNACDVSPAREPLALTVGATNSGDAEAWFSNHGTCLDLYAPGEGILSAGISDDNATETFDGTSMASPHVAGVAALYLEYQPSATPAQVHTALVNLATPNVVGGMDAGSPNKLLYSGVCGSPTVACPVPVTVTANAATVTINEGSTATNAGTVAGPAGTTLEASHGSITRTGGTWSWSHTLANGPTTLNVTVTARSGAETATASFAVTANNVTPTVSAGGNASINAGATLTRSGSFTDPGADGWAGHVDYGDGGGRALLTLTGKTFSLSHTYAHAGTFTVSVCIADGHTEGCGSFAVTVADPSPPSVEHSVSPSPDANGWNKTDVTVTWAVGDPQSGIASQTGCGTTGLTATPSTGTLVTCSATNGAGATTTRSVLVKIDKTGPTVAGTPSRPADHNGWWTSPVSVQWSGVDGGSGVASCSAATSYGGPDGSSIVVSGQCTDAVGNVGTGSFTLRYDATAPTASAVVSPTANSAGWFNSAVTVTGTGSDATSGIDQCTAVTLGTEGAGQTATVACTDEAGHSASATVSGIDIDLTAPAVQGSLDRAPDHGAWYNAPVTASWDGSDAGSTVASCDDATTYGGPDGSTVTLSGECTDEAGNVGTGSVTFRYDATAPSVSASFSPAANAAGWHNTDVVVSASATDATSGIAQCGSETLSAEGTNQQSTVGCTDNAGNSASATASGIDIDRTAPSVSGDPDRAPDRNGWYRQPVTVSWIGNDDLSGVDTCTAAATYGGPDDGSVTLAGSCTDDAGNTDGGTFELRYDATSPTIAFGGNAGTYTVDQTIQITCTSADALSGIDAGNTTCPAVDALASSYTLGAHPLSAGAMDQAGNTSTSATSFTVEVTFASLRVLVERYVANPGQENALIAKLRAAETARNATTRSGQIQALVNQVNALRGSALTAAQADLLITLATSL